MTALAELKRESKHDKVEISWKYVEASRLQGYKYWTALADLVDNSIDANSDKIQILIKGRIQSQVDELVIVDNGDGMNKETLKESYNLGARTNHLRSDLGKFGVGGTLGSIALGKVKYTFTRNKKNGKILARKLDLKECEDLDSFVSVEHTPTQEEITLFDELVGKKSTGTLIMLKKLDRLFGRRINLMESKLKKHFGETYYQHLQGSLSVLVNDSDVEPRDPICWFHPETDKLCNEKVTHEGVTYNIKCVNLLPLPRRDITGKDLVKDQGIYVQRNERVILQSCCNGDYFQGFWNREDRHRYFRALISFDSAGDEQMGLTTDKTSININDQVLMHKFQTIINIHALAASNILKAREKSSSKDDRRIDLKDAEDIMNKAIIMPKKQQKPSLAPFTINSVTDDIEEIEKHRGEKGRYTFNEVNHGSRGFLARITENKVIEINLDHPYLATYYYASSEETRKAATAWIASMYLSELEVGNYSDDGLECSMDDFFSRFEKRLAAWCRLS
jgi:hypothetical protein